MSDAMSNGTSNLKWQQETFAYADAHDGTTWVGVATASMVKPALSGYLIHPDHISVPNPGPGPVPGPNPADPMSFYAVFNLDRVRAIKQLAEILDNVTDPLKSDVEITIEVRAANNNGFDDKTRRVVSENATNLGAQNQEFS